MRTLILAVTSLLLFSCSTDDGTAEKPGGGKSDDLSAERCESATIDEHGFCRASDGTFAPTDCCEGAEALCTTEMQDWLIECSETWLDDVGSDDFEEGVFFCLEAEADVSMFCDDDPAPFCTGDFADDESTFFDVVLPECVDLVLE